MTPTSNLPEPAELREEERARVCAFSKTMFGNADRLLVAVGVAVETDGIVNATDLQWKLRLANNRIRAQLLALSELGFLEAAPIDGERGKRLYTRVADPFWNQCLQWYARALRQR